MTTNCSEIQNLSDCLKAKCDWNWDDKCIDRISPALSQRTVIIAIVVLIILIVTAIVLYSFLFKKKNEEDESFTGSEEGMVLNHPVPWKCPYGCPYGQCGRQQCPNCPRAVYY